jgi:hypothetical protein
MNGGSGFGVYSTGGFGAAGNGYAPPIRQPLTNGMGATMAGGNFPGMGGEYATYMGR